MPCAWQRPCVKRPAKTWIVRNMASIPGLVSGRAGMLQGACTRMHRACSFRMCTGQQHLLCQQAFSRSSLALSASPGPVDSIFTHAQALVATGISAVGMATIADKSSKIPSLLRCQIADIPGTEANALSDILLSFGASSTSVEEYRDETAPEQEIFQNSEGQCWDRCTVSALFPAEHDVNDTLRMAQDILQLNELQHKVEAVPEQEWVEAIKESYQPTKVCEGLWIVPDWCDPPEPSSLNIRMAPGLAFGTGEHSTTRLCLQWLHANREKLRGAHVMDYGTGSGVLAIAALLMGAASAAGTDVDPLAVKAALDNAKLNGVDSNFTVVQCSPSLQAPEPLEATTGTQVSAKFGVCIANILRGPLLELQPRLCSYLKPGGTLLLSGILTSQVPAVQDVYKNDIKGYAVAEETSWALLTGTKL